MNPTAESIARAAKAAQRSGGLPPVQDWDPPFRGDIEMRIARDGTWYYLGTPINRPELVRLFSTILRRDADSYYLVTPAEKVRIEVEDAPFIAVDFETRKDGASQTLVFHTNLGDSAEAGENNPIRVDTSTGPEGPSPYVHIRHGLKARIDRNSFYRLVELGEKRTHGGEEWFGVASAGAFFPLILASELGN